MPSPQRCCLPSTHSASQVEGGTGHRLKRRRAIAAGIQWDVWRAKVLGTTGHGDSFSAEAAKN